MRYDTLLARTKMQYPRMKIVRRSESLFLKILFWPLTRVTRKSYNEFITTIGSCIYVPDDFDFWKDERKYRMLRHEKEHLRQMHYWPISVYKFWPLNYVLVGFCYLFVFPVFLTMRAYFERKAYTQTLLVMHEYGHLNPKDWPPQTERLVKLFSGSAYFWMATKKATRFWALKTMDKIFLGQIKGRPEDVVDDKE